MKKKPEVNDSYTTDQQTRAKKPGHDRQPQDTGKGPLHTLVCITCGNEKFFTEEVPSNVKCDACGNSVFRNFDTPTRSDEAQISQLEDSARHVALGEGSPQTARDDLLDLNG
jgi:ribosomal protein S27E